MTDIRQFFEQIDIAHMAAKGYDFATYLGVRKNALAIFARTAPPNADVRPDAARHWSAARSETFKNWIMNGHPVGVASLRLNPSMLTPWPD
jgi:tyrosinase